MGISRAGAFEDVSLEMRRGEIVALVGLAGHGSFEVARSLCGLPPPERGEIRMDGRPIRLRTIRDALRHGIGFLAEALAQTIDPVLQALPDDAKAVVIASGDPLFFGVVRRIRAAGLKVLVVPAVTSLQLAFAAVALPWDDALLREHVRDAFLHESDGFLPQRFGGKQFADWHAQPL